MNRDRFVRVKDLFRIALPMDAAARSAYLRRECQGSDELLREVVDLLAHAESAGSNFLASLPPVESLTAELPALEIPGFRIVERIAAGGAGIVYRARQDFPSRDIALKVLRLDTLAPGQVARFRRESEILATLNHPGIAHVYGAGIVETGSFALPWIAMELVHGRTLDAYVAERRERTLELLALFRDLCRAVDHAHERGIVHRDLKPTNVLVDASGRPRVLDFGIGKILGDGDTGQTQSGAIVGTPTYMSPEQARGERAPIGPAADVYALGAMLYEALAARPPLDVEGLDIVEAARVVCQDDPPPLARIRPDLPSDLDAIVSKALEKDPLRRYARAGDLAADIENLLAHRPVRARRPTTIDHARKFVRRHRVVTVATSIVVVALVTALTISLVALHNLERQRAVTTETIEFFVSRTNELAAQLGFGEDQRANMEESIVRAERQLGTDPSSHALREAQAQALYELAALDQARLDHVAMRSRLERALAIREQLVRENPDDLGSWTRISSIYARLGEAWRELGDIPKRDAFFARALALDERLVRTYPDDPELLEDLGWSLERVTVVVAERGDNAEADRLTDRRLADALALFELDPSNWKYTFNLSHAHSMKSMRLCTQTDHTLDLHHAREAIRLARDTRDLEPGRRDFVAWLAHSFKIGSAAYLRAGRPIEANALAEQALSAGEELALADPRRPAHLDLVRQLADDLVNPRLGEVTRDHAVQASKCLRRVADVARRANVDATQLIATAAAIEAGTP